MVLDLGQCVALALDTPILDDLHKSLLDRITKNPLESQKSKTHHVEDALAVVTPLWGKCEDETHTPKSGNLESSGTLAISELDSRGQNTLP